MLDFQNNMPRAAVGMNRGTGTFQAQLQSIMAQMEALQAELQALLNQLAALQEPIPPGPNSSPQANQAYQYQLAQYESQVQGLINKINMAHAKLAALEATLDKLQASLAMELAKKAAAQQKAREQRRQADAQTTTVAGRTTGVRVITAKATIEGIQVAYLALAVGSVPGGNQSNRMAANNVRLAGGGRPIG